MAYVLGHDVGDAMPVPSPLTDRSGGRDEAALSGEHLLMSMPGDSQGCR